MLSEALPTPSYGCFCLPRFPCRRRRRLRLISSFVCLRASQIATRIAARLMRVATAGSRNSWSRTMLRSRKGRASMDRYGEELDERRNKQRTIYLEKKATAAIRAYFADRQRSLDQHLFLN